MSDLLYILGEHKKEFILVSEMLELMTQSTKSTLDQVKEYLLIIKLDEHVQVLYRNEKRLEFKARPNDVDGASFKSTYSVLTHELKGSEYFSLQSLNEFRSLDEHDIFAHKRGYHYVAQQSVGRFTVGDYVIGLTESEAKYLLFKQGIGKLHIKDIEARQSKQVKFLTSQLADAHKQIAELTTGKAKSSKTADNNNELSTRSQNLAAKVILALLDIADLDRESPPYQYDNLSSNNRLIYDQAKANNMEVSQQKIGHWLDLASKQVTDE